MDVAKLDRSLAIGKPDGIAVVSRRELIVSDVSDIMLEAVEKRLGLVNASKQTTCLNRC